MRRYRENFSDDIFHDIGRVRELHKCEEEIYIYFLVLKYMYEDLSLFEQLYNSHVL